MYRTQGTLIVKKIPSRNGPFRVGDLVTDVAEFKVKDPLLDQFEEGEYRGTFFISEIFMAPYVAFGRCVTELRARLHDIRIDSQARPKRGVEPPEEPDPIDETPAPRARLSERAGSQAPLPRPGRATKQAPDPVAIPPDRAATDSEALGAKSPLASVPVPEDEALFGVDIALCIRERGEVRLDPTIDDRARFRAQTARLRSLNYAFISQRQVWVPN